MNPRYQVFVSSTFRDLQNERQGVLEGVLELGHYPAGMEIFPAANATPWNLIETIIAESDYYVLIVGGTYGSTDENGVSYTEKEYDLAVKSDVPILAFLHKNPAAIPAGLSEMHPKPRARLEAFRKKVQNHHCKYWANAEQLKAQAVIALTHAMRTTPRIGWIRTNAPDKPETLQRLTSALEENARLREQVTELEEAVTATRRVHEALASGDDPITLSISVPGGEDHKITTKWDAIFLAIGPAMLTQCAELSVAYHLNSFLTSEFILSDDSTTQSLRKNNYRVAVTPADFRLVMYQFIALDHVEPLTIVTERPDSQTRREAGYQLTKRGSRTLAERRALRKQQ